MKELVKPLKTIEREAYVQALMTEHTCVGYCTAYAGCTNDCFGSYNDAKAGDDILF